MNFLKSFVSFILLSSCFENVSFTEEDALKAKASGSIILDVRSAGEYQKKHIKGSTWIPINELEERSGELDKTKTVVVYCAIGGRSKKAVSILKKKNFNNIKDIKSIDNWPIKSDFIKGE